MISTSFFELFKVGPGPSSSHTVGPMIASKNFREQCIAFLETNDSFKEISIEIELYGSLSATGKGHGTDRAVLAGLYGYEPTNVDIDRLNRFFTIENEVHDLHFSRYNIPFKYENITFKKDVNPYKHPNTLRCILIGDYKIAYEGIFYSVGGGFVEQEGLVQSADEARIVPYIYDNMANFVNLTETEKISAIEILYKNEVFLSGFEIEIIDQKIDFIIDTMMTCVESGLCVEGILPGGLNVHRRAKNMIESVQELEASHFHKNTDFSKLNAYALAVSEENAAGHMVVTAPTNGAAGVIPAAVYYLEKDQKIEREKIREGILLAGLIGYIIKHNASISGAELGCMAEVGSATAMAAAMITHCFGGDIYKISIAAEIALEHSLGMTCDPINGLVQVPCIERNATGIVKAYNSSLLSMGRKTKPLISFDQAVKTMKETGTDLSAKYKETSSGGLAIHGWGNMPGS
jgi:L-serine dehydratase